MSYLDEYQEVSRRTVPAEQIADNTRLMTNAALGLAGESGEVADMIKKHVFQGHEFDGFKLAEEIGDVLWYLARCADVADITLEECARRNTKKLLKRYPHGFSAEDSIARVDHD